jgi:class 3 adenylate cyclase/predicted ATPase
MDVSSWLRDLGLEHYAQAFRAHDVDAEVLPRLTADDLTALGIRSVGHRRRLLDAIAALDRGRGSAAGPSAATTRPVPAERRQLTVLFCDLVGSTELATRLDPEDLREVMRAYQGACADVVCRFEGHLARFLGDGALAYFGWPRAHEDDAERAIRAGLQLVEGVARLEPRAEVRLQARVGVATGQVVVGDLIDKRLSDKDVVSGDTPNLAARLQALAAPGSVVISQSTRRLVGRAFELTDLGRQCLKGFAEPLSAWQVEGQGHAQDRFEARQTTGLTPLVGRGNEIALLLRRWQQARKGQGQVVLLSGEPGIGKSRLVREVRERIGAESHVRLSLHCSPYHQTSPLHPAIEHLERAAGFERDDLPQAKLDKLEGLLTRGSDTFDESVPLLAALLAVPTGDRYPALTLTPEVQKRRTLQALLDQLVRLAVRQPMVALCEDVHWIDPSTLELVDLVIERVRQLPVLALITFRPEFQPPWTGQAHVSTLSMERLARRQCMDLVARVTSEKPLPAEIVEQIVARTDGVPLFIEELTKAVMESGLLTDAGDRWELSGPLPPLAIPTTLHDSLMARLDRLAPVKEVAQIGAAIGREFSHVVLAAVTNRPEAQLRDALDQLISSELVFRRGTPPEAIYSFKHAMVQDAAYQSLLKSKRQQLHARIADVLEQRFSDVGDTQPEVLAQHLTEADSAERAIPYWRRAGELAAGRSANPEAIAHLSKGLDLVGALPNAPERREEELALLLALGAPLIATKGLALEVGETYTRASALCEQLGRATELFPVLRGLWHWHLVRGQLQRAQELSERLVALADAQEIPLHRALARRTLGTSLFFLGRFTDAATVLNKGIEIDDAIAAWEDRAHVLLYTERASVGCRMNSARILWLFGFSDRASDVMEAALALCQRIPHPYSLASALNSAALMHNSRREFDTALRRAEAVINLASEHHLLQMIEYATMCRGTALVGLGQVAEGMTLLRAGLVNWHSLGAHLYDTEWLGFLAQAHLAAGQLGNALSALDQATETAAATGESHHLAELHWLRGLVLAASGDTVEAESWLKRAIDTARSQQAKSLELRAATSLARLWSDQGKRAEAHDLLAPVYGWFTEGFETADLKDAKALLDELA